MPFPEVTCRFERYLPLRYIESDNLTIGEVLVVGLATVKKRIYQRPGLVKRGPDGNVIRVRDSVSAQMLEVVLIIRSEIDLADPRHNDLYVIVRITFPNSTRGYYLLTKGDLYWPVVAIDEGPDYSNFPQPQWFELRPRRRINRGIIAKLETLTTEDHGFIGRQILQWLVGPEKHTPF
jgi:hypothetical protein